MSQATQKTAIRRTPRADAAVDDSQDMASEPMKSVGIKPKKALRRRSRAENNEMGDFHIPSEYVPDGYAAEWKLFSVLGKEEDGSYEISLRGQGWEPATTDMGKLKGLMPPSYNGKSIFRKGMMLYVRPMEYTQEAREEDYQIARDQVSNKMTQIGQQPKDQLERRVLKAKRNYEPVPVDED